MMEVMQNPAGMPEVIFAGPTVKGNGLLVRYSTGIAERLFFKDQNGAVSEFHDERAERTVERRVDKFTPLGSPLQALSYIMPGKGYWQAEDEIRSWLGLEPIRREARKVGR
jgi:hypothetical protein